VEVGISPNKDKPRVVLAYSETRAKGKGVDNAITHMRRFLDVLAERNVPNLSDKVVKITICKFQIYETFYLFPILTVNYTD